jgi:glycosyltransferase involved in cell wall biosynthesis
MRGGERCLEQFLTLFPDAHVYSLFHLPGATSSLIDEHVRGTSWLQQLPRIERYYRCLLPLFPLAVRSINIEPGKYDVVISLSHAAAKNVKVPHGTRHIVYLFTPMRYIWDQVQAYFGRCASHILWPILAPLRRWDFNGSTKVDELVSISRFVSARARCFYRRNSSVIYPPVDTSWIKSPVNLEAVNLEPSTTKPKQGEAFLFAGALVPYKGAQVVIEAFNTLGLPLWVVGDGPDAKVLRSVAKKNITFFGRISDNELAEVYGLSRALVFPAIEDFGMIPVEVMAAGRPVIGVNRGGVAESVIGVAPGTSPPFNPLTTGVLMPRASLNAKVGRVCVEHLIVAIRYFIEQAEGHISTSACIERSRQFSPERFFHEWHRMLLKEFN